MFDLEKAIQDWLRLFRKHQAFNHGSVREMELHLRDHIDDLVASGQSQKDAFDLAVKDFGKIHPMAREEFKNLIPKSTLLSLLHLSMLKNYFLIATRNFRRHKFYAFVNVLGLTIGLSIVFLIGLFVTDELSFDQFHAQKDRIYRVVENQYYADQPVFPVAVTPTAVGPALVQEYPEISKFTRLSRTNDQFEFEGEEIMEGEGYMVDAQFFDMFSFPIIQGSVDAFHEKINGLVLNEELVEKYFPNKNPIGEFMKINGEEFEITAVIKDVPKNSHLSFRYLTNFEKYLSENPDGVNSWGSNWLYTYVELSPSADLEEVNEKIVGLIKANSEESVTDIYLQPMLDIYLGEVDFVVEVTRKGEMQYVKIFTIVAIIILLISCINFMNLSTARSAKRAKEVGLRKTVGAHRYQLIVQFLSESVLLTMIAVVLAAGIVLLILPSFNQLANKEFDLGLMIGAESGMLWIVGIVFAAIITGLIAGSYPAIYLSSLKPVETLTSEVVSGKKGAGLRKILVVMQFTISVILIIGTVVVYQQLQFVQNVDLGYNKENVLYTFVPGEKSEVFANELREQAGITSVGVANRHPGYILSSTSGFDWTGKNPDETILFHTMGVDEHYMRTMEMNILEGRHFSNADSAVVMINEKAREIMGLENPVGETISAMGDRKIVGVVEDFNFKSIHTAIEPIVIFKLSGLNRIYVKYQPEETDQIVSTVEDTWNRLLPDREFDYYFLEEDFKEMYSAEQRTSTLSTYFAGLAILISCLGLFGLVSYATEQRTKEVGIRKVLGASVQNLFLLLTGDFTRLVLVSLVISVPVGWFAMQNWLEGFAYHIDLSPWVFIMSGAGALAIALLTVSYQSVRASISNPIRALRDQ